jgi:hypothetical protein
MRHAMATLEVKIDCKKLTLTNENKWGSRKPGRVGKLKTCRYEKFNSISRYSGGTADSLPTAKSEGRSGKIKICFNGLL